MARSDNFRIQDRYLDHPLIPNSRQEMPTNITDAMQYCLRLWLDTPLYRAVTDRTVGHFLTRLNFRGEVGSDKEKEEFEKLFLEEIDGLLAIRQLGQEAFCYGTAFLRCHTPFTRILTDRRGGLSEYTLAMFPEETVTFDLPTMTYTVPDPKAEGAMDSRPKTRLTFRDRPLKDFSKIRLRNLNPRYCRLRYSETSGSTQVEYMFEPETKRRVKAGELLEVNNTPRDMLQAMQNNGSYLFHESAVYILKEPTISGISNEGWGLPPILAHFPSIHRISVLDRVDESIAKNLLLPYRIIAPDLRNVAPGEGQQISGEWKSAAARMFAEQGQDPSKIHAFPFPFSYQNLGGDGQNFTPRALRDVAVTDLYRGMGIPVEMFDASLNAMQMPAALRLFEMSHMPLGHGLAKAVRWAVRKITGHMFGEEYDVTLEKPSVANDIEERNLLFSLYSSRDIPARVAFDSLGLENPVDLRVEAQREQIATERRIAALMKEEEIKAQMGSIDAVLDNAQSEQQAQGGQSVTPVDLRAEAEQLAQQWLSIPQDGERAKAMRQVEATNKDLYAVAKDIMEEIRSQGGSQGRQQAAQQFQGAG